jgi:hypothetical protein
VQQVQAWPRGPELHDAQLARLLVRDGVQAVLSVLVLLVVAVVQL